MKYFSWLWNNSRGIRWNTVVRMIESHSNTLCQEQHDIREEMSIDFFFLNKHIPLVHQAVLIGCVPQFRLGRVNKVFPAPPLVTRSERQGKEERHYQKETAQ